MQFRCIVSYRSTGGKNVLNWRTSVQATDIASVMANVIEQLKPRQYPPLAIMGIYVQLQIQAKV